MLQFLFEIHHIAIRSHPQYYGVPRKGSDHNLESVFGRKINKHFVKHLAARHFVKHVAVRHFFEHLACILGTKTLNRLLGNNILLLLNLGNCLLLRCIDWEYAFYSFQDQDVKGIFITVIFTLLSK